MEHLERHPLTRGHVNFNDQTINGRLALSSSISGRHATLDMKEASDRISKNLVELLFDGVPKLRDALFALSTDYITLPDGTHLPKRKFAPMGSALCFPVMSIVHFALGLAALQLETRESPFRLKKHLYVYGDDLIVTTKHAKLLIDTFPVYGLKFNVDKSCIEGKFRESCGVDAFMGVDITPQRVKTYALSYRKPSSIQTCLAMFHGFFNRGLWNIAKHWRQYVEDSLGWLPCVSKRSAGIGWVVPVSQVVEANEPRLVWNKHLQSFGVVARKISARPTMSMIGGWERFVRSQTHVVSDISKKFGNIFTQEPKPYAITVRGREKISRSFIPLSGL